MMQPPAKTYGVPHVRNQMKALPSHDPEAAHCIEDELLCAIIWQIAAGLVTGDEAQQLAFSFVEAYDPKRIRWCA